MQFASLHMGRCQNDVRAAANLTKERVGVGDPILVGPDYGIHWDRQIALVSKSDFCRVGSRVDDRTDAAMPETQHIDILRLVSRNAEVAGSPRAENQSPLRAGKATECRPQNNQRVHTWVASLHQDMPRADRSSKSLTSDTVNSPLTTKSAGRLPSKTRSDENHQESEPHGSPLLSSSPFAYATTGRMRCSS